MHCSVSAAGRLPLRPLFSHRRHGAHLTPLLSILQGLPVIATTSLPLFVVGAYLARTTSWVCPYLNCLATPRVIFASVAMPMPRPICCMLAYPPRP